MKYYIATTLTNYKEHNKIRDLMNELGHKITYDWTESYLESVAKGNVHPDKGPKLEYSATSMQVYLNKDDAERERIRIREEEGVTWCSLFIMILPGKGGTHVELGMALKSMKDIILLYEDANDLTTIFYESPSIKIYKKNEFIEMLEDSIKLKQQLMLLSHSNRELMGINW